MRSDAPDRRAPRGSALPGLHAGRGRLRRERVDAQLRALAHARPRAATRRRARRHEARPRRQRRPVARARARPRPDRAAGRAALRHHARPRRPRAQAERAHARRPSRSRRTPSERSSTRRGSSSSRTRSARWPGPTRSTSRRTRRSTSGRSASTCCSARRTSSSGRTSASRSAARSCAALAPVQGAPGAERAGRRALRDRHARARAARGVSRGSRLRERAGLGRDPAHERELGEQLLAGLGERCTLHGLPTMDGRVPTFALTHTTLTPDAVAPRLAERKLAVWPGTTTPSR